MGKRQAQLVLDSISAKGMVVRMVATGRRLRKLWPLWVVLAALLAVVLVLFLPPLLIAPYGLKDPERRLAAENALRTTLAGTLAGMAVIAGAIVGALNFRETSRQNRATSEQNRAVLELQRRGQVTERFGKAIEQLGQSEPDQLDVRLGAIYALEQIAQDSPELHWPIMEVLTAHLREYRRTRPQAPAAEKSTVEDPDQARLPTETQAIATVIGRRRHEQDPPNQSLDLHEVDLSGVQWPQAHLARANLRGAKLNRADLSEAQLNGAYLVGAQLNGADLTTAQLNEADLAGAQLNGASLSTAKLNGAHLSEAQLNGAFLLGARLNRADLSEAQLNGAHLFGAHLDDAYLFGTKLKWTSLTKVRLNGAHLGAAGIAGTDLTETLELTWEQVQEAANWELAKLPSYLVAQRTQQPGPSRIEITEERKVDTEGQAPERPAN